MPKYGDGPMRSGSDSAVLVVDDDEEFRAAVVALLADEGFAAVEAPKGRAAINSLFAAAVLPPLILLDVNMPGPSFMRRE
jgi:CheY-like chemotaxis protein